ncbi:MAG: acylphosphatase [Acidimicrobiia bacterium]
MSAGTRRHVYVSGAVQGVWFRDACSKLAQSFGVTGWVRNLDDGRVEAVFEGSDRMVEAMVGWCHEGPPRAKVQRVDSQIEEPEGLEGFEVR